MPQDMHNTPMIFMRPFVARIMQYVPVMASKTVQIGNVTFDLSNVKEVFAGSGYQQWGGRVAIRVAGSSAVITANWAGEEELAAGRLVDFEGEGFEGEMEQFIHERDSSLDQWTDAIAKALGRPSYWNAHNNDITDRKAARLPPFHI